MRITDIPELKKLSPEEKILLVEDLWDSIAEDESAIPIPESHRAELDRRLKALQSAPGSLLSLQDLRSRLQDHK